MEHITYNSIIDHLNQNNIQIEVALDLVTQLITLTEDISFALDHHKQTDIILLDFSNASDTVPHQRLATN